MDDRTMERNEEVEIDLQRLILAVVQRARQGIAAGVLCAVIALLVLSFKKHDPAAMQVNRVKAAQSVEETEK